MLIHTLDIISNNLSNNSVVTKRDIFYKGKWLYKSQYEVDRMIDDIAATLNVSRHDLGIVASPKGIMAGYYVMKNCGGDITKIGNGTDVTLVPTMEADNVFIVLDDINYVLVIEKEAVFQRLVSSGFYNRPELGRALLITVVISLIEDVYK